MSETVKLNGLNIQLRTQAPYDIVFTTVLPEGDLTAETVNVAMDMLTEVADRERLKGELASHRDTLRRNEEILQTKAFDKQIAAIRNQRARFDAQVTRHWISSSRRGEPKLNSAQQTQMEAFDTQINQALEAKFQVENGILLELWKIDCLQARLAGQPEPPMPPEIGAAIEEVDMPETLHLVA